MKELPFRQDTVVVDLDGTLADVNHRIPLVKTDHPDWDEFYKRVADDKLNVWCKKLIKGMRESGHRVVIVSARPQTLLEVTSSWLYKHGVIVDNIFMLREVNKGKIDFTPDRELKRRWLAKYGKERVLFAVDDRQRVVDMWREEGVVCLQCQSWKEWKDEKKEK